MYEKQKAPKVPHSSPGSCVGQPYLPRNIVESLKTIHLILEDVLFDILLRSTELFVVDRACTTPLLKVPSFTWDLVIGMKVPLLNKNAVITT